MIEAQPLKSGSIREMGGVKGVLTYAEQLALDRVEEVIRRDLSGMRLGHSLRVRDLSVRLAQSWIEASADPERDPGAVLVDRVAFAALVHDWAKGAPTEEVTGLVRSGKMNADEETLAMEKLHHGLLSAYRAEKEFGVHDPEILDAIRFHPTGDSGFATLGQILFVSDFAEPGRDLPGADAIRALAERDLQGAAREVLKRKLMHLVDRGHKVHSRAWRYWNELAGAASSGL